MNYQEIIIAIPDEQSLREKLMAQLLAIGFDSFMETETSIAAYIHSDLFNQDGLNKVLTNFQGKALIEEIRPLPDQNWNALWESNYEPVLIDERCLVRAPFHEKPSGIEFDIVIQPKMSFGTAHHSTTSLMISMILNMEFDGKTVVDMGTGTGILAILASMKGAQKVIAVDNDDWAYNNAAENCGLNHIKNIDVIFGDVSAIPEGRYDYLLANINRNILLEDIRRYNAFVKNGATVLLSGFYEHDVTDIIAEAAKYNWKLINKAIKNEWAVTWFKVNGS